MTKKRINRWIEAPRSKGKAEVRALLVSVSVLIVALGTIVGVIFALLAIWSWLPVVLIGVILLAIVIWAVMND